MATKSEQERLAVLETKVDTILANQKQTNEKLDLLLPTFVTKDEHDKTVVALEKEIEVAKRKSSIQVWVTGTLSAAFGVVLALLITYFVSTIGKGTTTEDTKKPTQSQQATQTSSTPSKETTRTEKSTNTSSKETTNNTNNSSLTGEVSDLVPKL